MDYRTGWLDQMAGWSTELAMTGWSTELAGPNDWLVYRTGRPKWLAGLQTWLVQITGWSEKLAMTGWKVVIRSYLVSTDAFLLRYEVHHKSQ